MNISTLAKTLGVSVQELRDLGAKNSIRSLTGRNTRVPYNDALKITQILKPERVENLQNDDNIYLPHIVKVADLADAIGKPAGLVVKTLMMNGVLATLNEVIDFDTAALIAEEMGVKVLPEKTDQNLENNSNSYDNFTGYFQNEGDGKFVNRPPVVTIMGHVDHGKTTLLDTIRKSNVVASEAGSITQHISSYQVDFNNKKITFIDTPGHAAFTAMRARGTQLADIIILVVSATEGPKPQTVEVIERAKIYKNNVIVAINKIDLPEADPEKVKADIAGFGLVPEEWGGNVPFIEISAKQNLNIDKLLENILLISEVQELKGEVQTTPQAVVLESHLDKQKGSTAVVLITKDEIKVADYFACGENTGRVRKITDGNGKNLEKADLCMPVEITGLSQVANTGDLIYFYKDAKNAENKAAENKKASQNTSFLINKNLEGGENDIKIILKADVLGSLEALKESIVKIPQEQVKIIILNESVGEVTENDVNFAQTSNSIILAFHTNISSKNKELAKKNQVNIISSDVIYEILEWLEAQVIARTKIETKVEIIGKAKVLGVFKSEKSGVVVFGGEVIEGKILDSKLIRVQKNEEFKTMEIVELQKNKVKEKEVNISQQFGISCKGSVKIAVGDIIECIDEVVVNKKQ